MAPAVSPALKQAVPLAERLRHLAVVKSLLPLCITPPKFYSLKAMMLRIVSLEQSDIKIDIRFDRTSPSTVILSGMKSKQIPYYWSLIMIEHCRAMRENILSWSCEQNQSKMRKISLKWLDVLVVGFIADMKRLLAITWNLYIQNPEITVQAMYYVIETAWIECVSKGLKLSYSLEREVYLKQARYYANSNMNIIQFCAQEFPSFDVKDVPEEESTKTSIFTLKSSSQKKIKQKKSKKSFKTTKSKNSYSNSTNRFDTSKLFRKNAFEKFNRTEHDRYCMFYNDGKGCTPPNGKKGCNRQHACYFCSSSHPFANCTEFKKRTTMPI